MTRNRKGKDVELIGYRITRDRRLEDTHAYSWDYPWSKSQALACRFGDQFHPATEGDVQEIGRAARNESVIRVHDAILAYTTESAETLADFVVHCLHDKLVPTALIGIITIDTEPEIWILEAGQDGEFAPQPAFESALKAHLPDDRDAWPSRPKRNPFD